MNVMPVLAEIRERMATHREGHASHVINFTLLPMSDADIDHFCATLGNGPIQLFSRGYGSCRVLATGARNVWSVQFLNAMDTPILDTLEIGDVPRGGLRRQRGFSRFRRAARRNHRGLFHMSGFENFGRVDADPQARMECGVCWTRVRPGRGRSRSAASSPARRSPICRRTGAARPATRCAANS